MGRNNSVNRKAASDKISSKKKKEQAKAQNRKALLKSIVNQVSSQQDDISSLK